MSKKAELENILTRIPDVPGVYLMKNASGKIIYVGKSKHLKARVNSYFKNERDLNFAKQLMVKQVATIDFLETKNEEEALFLEANFIKKNLPKYNVLLKDDKNYAYILVTDETIPEVIKIRQKNRKWTYFGPYISTAQVHTLLDFLHKYFHLRSCKATFGEENGKLRVLKTAGRKIPCLDYYIHLCSGPCLLRENILAEYSEHIEQVKEFLGGNTQGVILSLQREMKQKAQVLEFEKAAKIKEQIESVRMVGEKYLSRGKSDESFEVFVYLHKYNKHFVGRTIVEKGEIVSVEHFIAHSLLEEDEQEIIEQTFAQIYAPQTKKRQVIVSDLEIPMEVQRGLHCQVVAPQVGIKQDLLSFARNNLLHFSYKTQMEAINQFSLSRETHEKILKELHMEGPYEKKIIFECFDISHLQGRYTVASKSVLVNGKSEKWLYRKYKISSLSSGKIDDFQSLYEVISRRMQEGYESKNFPTLFIIDGGKGQLSSVVRAMRDAQNTFDSAHEIKIPFVCSLAKELEEIFVEDTNESIRFSSGSQELMLMQQIRDEAHRFAIGYNRNTRNTEMKKTILDQIPGIGPITRKKLLKAAGSVDNLKDLDEKTLNSLLSARQKEALQDHGLL